MLHAAVAAAFEHVHEADDVAVDVGVRVLQRIAHAGLRGEVDHAVEATGLEELRHARTVGHVELDEAEALVRRQPRQPGLLEADVVVVVEVVEADDLIAARQQAQRGGHADEAGGAGEQNFHGWMRPAVRARLRSVDSFWHAPPGAPHRRPARGANSSRAGGYSTRTAASNGSRGPRGWLPLASP